MTQRYRGGRERAHRGGPRGTKNRIPKLEAPCGVREGGLGKTLYEMIKMRKRGKKCKSPHSQKTSAASVFSDYTPNEFVISPKRGGGGEKMRRPFEPEEKVKSGNEPFKRGRLLGKKTRGLVAT